MRALLPAVANDVDLHAWYAADWVDGAGLRMNFVASVDGAATDSGLSSGLQTKGDNRVFAALRDLADVVVAGAGTVRAEGYRAIQVSARRQELRAQHGLAPYLPTAVISRSLRLDPRSEVFKSESRQARTIVITGTAGDPVVLGELRRIADVIVAGDRDVDLTAARAALAERGMSRILCEGGPTLFADLARAGAVDELCLSISPLLAGPGARRIVAGPVWDTAPMALALVGLLEEDGALFCRYRVGAAPEPPGNSGEGRPSPA
ncbi:MAG: pyrimidine reductase family protein [Actinomycetota bacterium]|nr:pyrimidine reductase family protein [Actinomycetota bacterium]